MDVESSFMPESAPAQTNEQNLGLDDTYTELAKPGGKTPPSDSRQASLMSPESLPEREHAASERNGDHESETPESQHLQESFGSNDTEEEESGDSFMSPAAAASHRSDTRQASAQGRMSPPPARANQAFAQSVSDMSSSYLSGSSLRERPSSKASNNQAQDVPLPSSRAASSPRRRG